MNKKTALITGASCGIGRELARIHAERGGDVVAVSRGLEKLEALKAELEEKHGVQVYVFEKDLSVRGSAKELYDELKTRGIEVDYLVNNAGFGGIGKFHERDWSRDMAMIDLNVVVLVELTRYFLPDFVARKSGKILNVSSTASFVPGPLQAVYYATKAFVSSFSNAIAEELRGSGVTVSNLMPGATKTEFGRISGMDKTPMFRKQASARDVAEDGYRGMMRGELNIVSGISFGQRIMFALIPFVPKKFLLKQVRKMQEVEKS